MSDAEYEVIKEQFPEWGARVEKLAEFGDEYHMGRLWGMADAMKLTKQCGNATEFVMTAIYRAKLAQEGGIA